MQSSDTDLQAALTPLIAAASAQDFRGTAALLRDFMANGPAVFPGEWLELTARCLDSRDFDALSEPFRRLSFVGPNGHVLVIGPYISRREGRDVMVLSALLAKRLPLDTLGGVTKCIEEVQRADLRQQPQPILPVRCFASTGNVGGDAGEAFIVPDCWGWKDSAYGPAMNNMDEQLKRFEVNARRCVERIFDADSAALLLTPMAPGLGGERVRHRSYDIHEAGHAAGIGFIKKTEEALIPGYWYRCIEEWRACGVAFEVGARLLDEDAAGADLCSNVCTLFGMDAHRTSLDIDADVAVTMLMMDRMLANGGLKISGGRLALRDPSFRGLVRAFEEMRYECVKLTRKELQLEHPSGIMRLYGSVPYQESSVAIFEGMVREPCRVYTARN